METRRGRPPKVERTPGNGDAWIQISVSFNGQTATKVLEIRDYAGSVPGPMKNVNSILARIETILRDIFGALRDVP